MVVWLRARPETLAGRLEGAVGRPLLAGPDQAGSLAVLAAERMEAYGDAAHFAVATDDRTPIDIAEEVIALWR